jgi:hypothetical protein
MTNPLLAIMREGIKRNWCMTPYCTTCGSLEYRNKIKELAGPLGGPLANALEDIDINELTSVPKWQDGLLIAIIDLPVSEQVEGILKAWLPKANGNISFTDYVLFKITKYLPRQSDTRKNWIDTCMVMAIGTKDFSLVESLILVLGQDAKNYPELMTIATDYAKTSCQMRRVLLNACDLIVKVV